MCLSDAAQVLEVDGDAAVVDLRGTRRRVPILLITSAGEPVHDGDWLLVHTGLAVARISAAEAAHVNAIRYQGDSHV